VVQKIKSWFRALGRQRKFSVSDPGTFEELWSVNSSWVRMLSLLALLLIVLSIPLGLLLRSEGSYFGGADETIERQELEDQSEQIARLTDQLEAQETFIANIRKI
jgi:hypothetical protein